MSSNQADKINNSEILLIYEAKLCNPNGDIDDENRPRRDPKTGINLVSDVRLKRFFRNYIIDKFGEEYIWVTKVNGKHVDATDRLKELTKSSTGNDKDIVLMKCIDARLFGATIPKKKGEKSEKGEAISIIGPVQFTWGFSLHPVELVDSSSITSMFKGRKTEGEAEGRKTEGEAGTIGKDWRLYYSLIAFYGVINGRRAKDTKLTNDEIKVFDNLLWDSIMIDATTRSKIGHKPHLYMRIEHNNDYLIGDLRKYITSTPKGNSIRELKDLELRFDILINKLKEVKPNQIYMRVSDEFNISMQDLQYQTLPHPNLDYEQIICGNATI